MDLPGSLVHPVAVGRDAARDESLTQAGSYLQNDFVGTGDGVDGKGHASIVGRHHTLHEDGQRCTRGIGLQPRPVTQRAGRP